MIVASLVRKGNDVEIIFDDGSGLLLDYHVVVDNGIRKNDSLSDEQINYLKNRSELNKIKHQAFRFLSIRNHSSYELKLKLLKKKFLPHLIDEALESLKEKKYLDDQKFSHQLIEEKMKKGKSGSIKIKSELKKKGISRELADKLIDTLDQNQFYENACDLASKKYDQLIKKESDFRKIKQKLFSYLAMKGFGSDIITSAINKIRMPEETD